MLWATNVKMVWQLIQGSAPALIASEVWTFRTIRWSYVLSLSMLERSTVLL